MILTKCDSILFLLFTWFFPILPQKETEIPVKGHLFLIFSPKFLQILQSQLGFYT
ncbi:hypothetical protein STRDD04_00571 [Streptococcus sp. DD04]|nr:hypothetical protein STRDD04_00571 [Streptococcus sp. DD04]